MRSLLCQLVQPHLFVMNLGLHNSSTHSTTCIGPAPFENKTTDRKVCFRSEDRTLLLSKPSLLLELHNFRLWTTRTIPLSARRRSLTKKQPSRSGRKGPLADPYLHHPDRCHPGHHHHPGHCRLGPPYQDLHCLDHHR